MKYEFICKHYDLLFYETWLFELSYIYNKILNAGLFFKFQSFLLNLT